MNPSSVDDQMKYEARLKVICLPFKHFDCFNHPAKSSERTFT